jgi:oxalate decarboxylase/phosphoglucose isomerase-like protein (cupin superfamily)
MTQLSGMRFVQPDDVETLAFDWGKLQWLSEPKVTGAREFVLAVVTIEPGKGHLRHNHPNMEEILYVIEGEGTQMVDIDGEQRRHVGPGDLIHLPAGVFHETVNTGNKTLRFLVVFGPTGQEEILRSMPDCKIEPSVREKMDGKK